MKIFLTLLFIIPLLTSNNSARVWEVPGNCPTIQAGLDSCQFEDTVLVAPGTYYENIQWPTTQGIKLLSEMGSVATIIDGNSIGNVISISSGIDSTTLISGFTLKNGSDTEGGGIYCISSNPSLENLIISENFAEYGAGIFFNDCTNPVLRNSVIMNNTASNGGGGICGWNNVKPVFENNLVTGNTADVGGGFDFFNSHSVLKDLIITQNTSNLGAGISGDWSNLTVDSCTLSENVANNFGGGIFSPNCNLEINNCMFTENEAINDRGGAIYYRNNNEAVKSNFKVSISSSNFISNHAQTMGGGITIIQFDDSVITTILIDKCQFIGNTADYHSGLKIKGKISGVKISDCIFSENEAVRFTGALSFTDRVSGDVLNCLFESNLAATGGGNWNSGGVGVWSESNINFMNCTFTNNTASYGAGLTVGMAGFATATNCIFWGNTGQLAIDTLSGQPATLTVKYCDVQYGQDSVYIAPLCILNWEDGNIDENPLFRDVLNNDLHLMSTDCGNNFNSPCIDAGNPAYKDSLMDCDWGLGSQDICDMGAYSKAQQIVDVPNEVPNLPVEFNLSQNYPNPFNSSTKIIYGVPQSSLINIKIFDVLGNEIKTSINEEKSAGTYELTWKAHDLPSGVYFYRLKAGDFIQTKKMILLK